MNRQLCITKLENAKEVVVPAIFADKQFEVLLKKIQNKQLSQPERNYLSNAIKLKIKAVDSLKHLNLNQLYEVKKSSKELLNSIVASYRRSGIDLLGYSTRNAKALQPTLVVEEVIANYQEIDARIADVLPVYILKNLEKIDLFEIYDFAVENGVINFTGYIFNIVNEYYPDEKINRLLDALEKKKDKITVVKDTRYENAIDLIQQDKICRKWNIYILNRKEDYTKYFKLYGGAS